MRTLALYFILLIFGFFRTGWSQTFVIEPDEELQLNVQPGTELAREFFITNTHHEAIWLGWDIVSNTLPGSWNYSLCDNRICYNTVPTSAYMDPIDSGSFGFLRLTILNTSPGAGELVVRIFNEYTADAQTITYRAEHLSLSDKANSKPPSIYPNPVESGKSVSIENPNLFARKLELYDAFGQHVYSVELSGTPKSKIALPPQPSGLYFAQFLDDKGQKMVTQKVIVR
jgi:hypothetical protein